MVNRKALFMDKICSESVHLRVQRPIKKISEYIHGNLCSRPDFSLACRLSDIFFRQLLFSTVKNRFTTGVGVNACA